MVESNIVIAAIWSYGIAAAGFIAFALRLAVGWRGGLPAALLVSVSIVSAIWAGSEVVAALRSASATSVSSNVLDCVRYAIWFVFLRSLGLRLPRLGGPLRAKALFVRYWAVVLVGAALLASATLAVSDPVRRMFGAEASAMTFGLQLCLAIVGLFLIEQLLRGAAANAQWAIKPLCLGLAGMFGFDIFYHADAMLFGRHDINIWLARGVAHALVIPFVAVATARNAAWTTEMHVSRGVVLRSTALFVSGVFVLAVAVAGYFVRYVGGDLGKAFQIELLFAAVLLFGLVAFSGSFRSKLKVYVSKHFFSYRYDYREEWLRFTRALSADSSPRGVQERSINALADLVESPGGTLWLRQEDASFRPVARWNIPPIDALEEAGGPLGEFLERTGWVIDLVDYRTSPERYPRLSLPVWLALIPSAWLIVPLASGSGLVGFVILVTPRAAVDVNWEVLDLLKTAGRQAASYLGQIQATELLLESRKFDAFNRMSAFVVHDLKNLVAQLSLMLKNAERHRNNPEFQRDMFMTVGNVVGRMNKLMLQLRTETTPIDKPQPVDLETVVRRVCAAKSDQRVAIELDLTPRIYALGHEDRLEHVIGHLVQNGLDATPGSGHVSIRLRASSATATIEVADSGIGMTPEFIRERLFKPFHTTKPTGMGIGVYESSHYVVGLGGRIHVDSVPNAGTNVRVVLPLANNASAATANPLEAA